MLVGLLLGALITYSGSVLNSKKISFDSDDFILYLPEGKSVDDFNVLAVWCVDFNADYSYVEFVNL